MQVQQQESEETTAASLLQHAGRKTVEQAVDPGETLRVTPEEVALAAAALEGKREAEHAWHETTLPLEEAIHQLGLNATPEELAPEVASLRAEKTRQQQQRRRSRQLLTASVAAGLIACLIGVGLLWMSLAQSRRALYRALHPMTTLPIQKLALIPDNTPVHIASDTLAKLAKGDVAPENVSVDTRATIGGEPQSGTMFNNEWTLIKSNGVLLVNGWATAEFALNISNDDTGGLFSSRPGWLPANNLVPIQVPVYRLEDQQLARYLPNGARAESAANSVLMAVNVADRATAVQDRVDKAIQASNDNFSPISYAALKGDVLHLTGLVTTARLKKLAGQVAAQTLERLHLNYTVANDMKITDDQQ